jgi:hypothetical protein
LRPGQHGGNGLAADASDALIQQGGQDDGS